jgi:hypothetical protein
MDRYEQIMVRSRKREAGLAVAAGVVAVLVLASFGVIPFGNLILSPWVFVLQTLCGWLGRMGL